MDEYDSKLIVTLIAEDHLAEEAWKSNQDRYISPYDPYDDSADLSSREATPACQKPESKLELTFDHNPKVLQRGFVFGSIPRVCDILLGMKRQGFSGQHFCITFDGQGRLILKDTSTTKTRISYDGQGNYWRDHFTWILFDDIKEIIVTVGERLELKFRVVLPKKGDSNAMKQYEKQRDGYLEDSLNAPLPFGQLGIESEETTARPTQPYSPKNRPIYILGEELGRGSFGAVYKARDVSTGDIYAGKEFYGSNWKKEVEIMGRVSHKHIVQFVDFTDEGKPLLVMEYLSFGNMQVQHGLERITEEETVAVLYQGLQALDHLHTQGFAHRDIKPENILIQSRKPLNIKLGDFGLATDNSILNTLCGSYAYVAPEIWKRCRYTSAVDIWSLGVIIFEYIWGLPKPTRSYKSKSWGEDIIGAVEEIESDGVVDLLSTKMLRIEPQDRQPAHDCLKSLLQLGVLNVQTSQTGTATPALSEQPTEIWNPLDRVVEESGSPVQLMVPGKVQKRLRSSKSSPSTQVTKRILRDAEPPRESEYSVPHDTQNGAMQLPTVSIRGQVINFISAERLVNASNLLKAAGIHRSKLQKILIDCKITDTKPIVGYSSVQGTYISYQDGFKICRHINLEDDLLRNIVGSVGETAQERVDVHYQATTPSILIQGQIVYHRPVEKLINATNLLRAVRIRRTNVRKIMGECGVTNITRLPGKGLVQGSYVTYRDGLKICKHLDLDHGPLQEVMKDAEEIIDPEERADTYPETATFPMLIRGRVVYRSKEFINASHLLAIVGDHHVGRTLKGWGIPFVKNITGGPRGMYVSYRNGKRICRLLELQEDCIEKGQSDELPLSTAKQIHKRQVFAEECFEENHSADGNEDWGGIGNDQRLFREIAFENQDLSASGTFKQVSEEKGTLRGKRDESIEEGRVSDKDSNDATKDGNDQNNFDSTNEDEENCGPPSVVSNKPADVLDNSILGSHPPQVVVSSWSASEISHLSQVVPRMGYISPSPGGFPSFKEGYPSFGEELFLR